MRGDTRLSRRTVLAAGAAGLGVAGCLGDSPFPTESTGGTTDANGGGKGPASDGGEVRGPALEDFEDGAPSWRANTGVGTGSGVQGTVVRAGSSALELINIGGPGYDGSFTSLPGDGLPAYPQFGDTVSIWTRTDGGDRPTLGFCYNWQDRGSYTQNDGSGYAARLKLAHDEVELAKSVGGSDTVREVTPSSTPLGLGVWYRLTVATTADGTHWLTVHDRGGAELARVSIEDAEWSSGGVGVAYSGNETDGESSYWDHLVLES
jgi:hypothetical protein